MDDALACVPPLASPRYTATIVRRCGDEGTGGLHPDELPTIRLGHRHAKPATPGHKDVAVTASSMPSATQL